MANKDVAVRKIVLVVWGAKKAKNDALLVVFLVYLCLSPPPEMGH